MGKEKLIYIPLLIGDRNDLAEKIEKVDCEWGMVVDECHGGFTYKPLLASTFKNRRLQIEKEDNAQFHRRGALSESACKPLLGLLCALSLGVKLSQAFPGLSEVA